MHVTLGIRVVSASTLRRYLVSKNNYVNFCIFNNCTQDKQNMSVEKRMEPLVKPPILHRKSWDNLPILSMELAVSRNNVFEHHHKVLKLANYMKLTLIASYNMLIPYDEEFIYTAASKVPMQNETVS